MAKLSFFEILDKMNSEDCRDNTSKVQVSTNLMACQEIKGGSKLTIAAAPGTTARIGTDQVFAALVLIDRDRYNQIVAEEKEKEVTHG